jgi:hypothetical protein
MTTANYAILVVPLVGLGCVIQSGNGEQEGSSNNQTIAVPGSCDAVRDCCLSAPQAQQMLCFGGGSGDERACTLNLRSLRAQGRCP